MEYESAIADTIGGLLQGTGRSPGCGGHPQGAAAATEMITVGLAGGVAFGTTS